MTSALPASSPEYPTHPARVVRAWDETPSLRRLRLAVDPRVRVDHRHPGQVVKIKNEAGESYFALGSEPSADPAVPLELLVKRGSPVADEVIAQAVPDSWLEVSCPLGPGFPVAEAHGKDVLLFAAGTGIAPVRALIEHLLGQRDRFGRVTLFYGQRAPADFAYGDEHLTWERAGIRAFLCCSDPGVRSKGWGGPLGRVQQVAEQSFLGGSPAAASVAYLCGMRQMIQDVTASLERVGVPASRIFLNI